MPLPQGTTWIGALVSLTGLGILFVALDIIPTDPRKFEAPHWVVGAAGLAFFLAGIAVIKAPPPGTPEADGGEGPNGGGYGPAVGSGGGQVVAVGVGEVGAPLPQLANLKLPMRVCQSTGRISVGVETMYSVVYQKVQSSVGSTVRAL